MASNISYCPDTTSLTAGDLSLFPIDFVSQIDLNQYPILYDDLIDEELFSFSEMDHEHSQASSSPDSTQQQNQATNLVCGVCGAPAYGYNFDQITCESCKAFFRRNALRQIPNLRCRHNGSCVINVRTRRQCTYCRLKKCFDINMRKDWIRTEEEKELRQLQKLAKEQKKLNRITDAQEPLPNLPIVARKKKTIDN